MATYTGLVDYRGRPIEKPVLTQEVAGPSLASARSPLTGYPGDGLTPPRLAQILREADMGDPVRYLELAETVEERDHHYAGVLGTRRRSVSQLEVTVAEAGDTPLQKEQADRIRGWLQRDELQSELFDMLDAIGKGYAFVEIMWDTSSGQWDPRDLCWRDPRWFAPDRGDLTTPLLRSDNGELVPLPPGKFILPVMRAKSGLPVRSGIARVALWGWLFKAYTNRDWQAFAQNYGQPVRVGKYGPGASEGDKSTLLRAVANIAGDCAAIIPASMEIDFVESSNVGAGADLFEKRANWIDQQTSKLVLGQTATTDAISGGHAVSQEHREVQEDIERADAKAIAQFINRDLIRPWIDLEFGPPADGKYPRVLVGRPDVVDVKLTTEAVAQLVPMGLKVGQRQMRDIIGIGAPDQDDELLIPSGAATSSGVPREPGERLPALNAEQSAVPASQTGEDVVAEGLGKLAQAPADAILEAVRQIFEEAHSLEEAKAMLAALDGKLSPADMALAMRQGLVLAQLIGRAEMGHG